MKRTEMRIVGLAGDFTTIQRRVNREWKQTTIDVIEFERMMKEEFAEYWDEYEKANTYESAPEWFYHYGETLEMIRKGNAYIYR